jgi:hypothetical protein
MIHGIQSHSGTFTHSKSSQEKNQQETQFKIDIPESTSDKANVAFSEINSSPFSFMQQQAIEEALARMQLELRSMTEPSSEKEPVDDARQAFLDWMQLTDTEKMRANILNQLGLTEDKLAELTPEEREEIEAIIEQRIEELVERKNAEQMETTG